MSSITLLDIAIRQRPKVAMQTLESVYVSQANGLDGDFRGKPGARQVTVLSVNQWQLACKQVGVDLPWTFRRANFLVSGIDFSKEMVGRKLKLNELILQITRETDPCERMDQQQFGLQKALMPDWRGGVCCRVLNDAEVRVGDTLTLVG